MFSILSNYSIPIITAVTMFPFIVGILALPFLVWNYRKYNGLSAMRAVVIFSFVFYMMCAFFLTLLPLPTIEEVLKNDPVSFNYHLFNNILYAMEKAGFAASNTGTWVSLANWKKLLTSFMLFQIIANIVMQVPLGFYLRYYFRVSWKKTLGIGFLVSFFFEMTQLSGVWGIYPYAFRCPDVDDLMNNTLGCMIGFWAAPILMRFLPSIEQMDEISAKRGEKLGILRGFTAFAVDWVVCVFISLGMNYLGAKIGFFSKYSDVFSIDIFKLLLYGIYFVMLPKIWKKQTIGNALVGVKVVNNANLETKVSALNMLMRNIVLYMLEPMAVVAALVLIVNTAYSYVEPSATYIERAILTGSCIIFFPIVFVILVNSVWKKGGLPHSTWTNTHLVLDGRKK